MDTSRRFSINTRRTYSCPTIEIIGLSAFCDNAMGGTVSLDKMEKQPEEEIGWDDDDGVNLNSSLWDD